MNQTTLLKQLRDFDVLNDDQLAGIETDAGDDEAGLLRLTEELTRKQLLSDYQALQLRQGNLRRVRLGPYVLIEKIGAGGFGEVFKARHALMERIVALKLISEKRIGEPIVRQRFLKEVRAATKLHHPNIVLAYDAADIDGELYLAMELIEGRSLQQVVRQHGPLPVTLAVHMLLQTAQALRYSHEKGMIHRDIKPANILTIDQGLRDFTGAEDVPPTLVKVVDFGLVRSLSQTGVSTGTSIRNENGFIGTPDYVAPEQAQNADGVDIRADLFSLGCTFYFALTGKKPFQGNSIVEVIMQRVTGSAEPIEKLRPELSEPIVKIFRRLMQREPAQRYANPAELISDINHVLGRKSSPNLPLLFPNIKPFSHLSIQVTPPSDRDTSRAEEDYSRTAISPNGNLDLKGMISNGRMDGDSAAETPLDSSSQSIQGKLSLGITTSDSSNSDPIADAKASQELPDFWQTWVELLEAIIERKTLPLTAREYRRFHRRLLHGIAARATLAKPDAREDFRTLEGVISPWLNLQVLLQTDAETLKGILERSRKLGQALSVTQPSLFWVPWVIGGCIFINIVPFIWSLFSRAGEGPIRQRITWSNLLAHVENNPNLSLALFVSTSVVVLYGLYRRFFTLPPR